MICATSATVRNFTGTVSGVSGVITCASSTRQRATVAAIDETVVTAGFAAQATSQIRRDRQLHAVTVIGDTQMPKYGPSGGDDCPVPRIRRVEPAIPQHVG